MEDMADGGGVIGLPLTVRSANGHTADELVAVSRLAANRYLVHLSPGLYRGIASGDEIEYDPVAKSAKVLVRGGNIAIHVFHRGVPPELVDSFKHGAIRIGGRIDGEVAGRLVVATFPAKTGFPAIESLMRLLQEHGAECEYGNVYDENGNPLNWWD